MKNINYYLILAAILFSLSSCVKKINGCTDPEALNYKKEANNDDGSCRYLTIGQNYNGGKIAYIFQSYDNGYVAGQKHGLIVATADQSAGAPWGCTDISITGAQNTGVGTGNQNTMAIVAGCSTAGTAARICSDLVLEGYSDWYLPSLDDLDMIYINKDAIGGFSNGYYWTSSEEIGEAWSMNFGGSFDMSIDTKDSYHYVRAVRSF